MKKETFGEKLKALRMKSGKSQIEVVTDIERMFGSSKSISQTTLSNLELRASPPRKEVVELLASYYQIPVSYFLDNEETESAEDNREMTREYLRSLSARNYTSQVAAHRHDIANNDEDVEKNLKEFSERFEDEEF